MRSSVSSTVIAMSAWSAGCALGGVARMRKSGPSWATGSIVPLINSRISTFAERRVCVGMEVMDEELIECAKRFAELRGLQLLRQLGFGVHGIVFEAKDQGKLGRLAVKFLSDSTAFERECLVYRRLRELGVRRVLGFNVPQFLHSYRGWRAIEMTMVSPPFVLDFAAAYLGRPPEFPPDVMAEWEDEKREQFGERWETVQRVLAALRDLGIHQTDVSPTNIMF